MLLGILLPLEDNFLIYIMFLIPRLCLYNPTNIYTLKTFFFYNLCLVYLRAPKKGASSARKMEIIVRHARGRGHHMQEKKIIFEFFM